MLLTICLKGFTFEIPHRSKAGLIEPVYPSFGALYKIPRVAVIQPPAVQKAKTNVVLSDQPRNSREYNEANWFQHFSESSARGCSIGSKSPLTHAAK
jgi:hypothetical protein